MLLEVRWSLEALEEFQDIYDYWSKRNKSLLYSQKLWKSTEGAISIIRKNPQLGIPTNHPTTRMRLIAKNYYLIYRIQQTYIEILKFWDVRQNPKKNLYT